MPEAIVADEAQDQAQVTEDSAPDSEEQAPASDPEATWKKRLNGQTAATAAAIRERDELRQRLAAIEAKERSKADSELVEVTQVREALEAERRAKADLQAQYELKLLDIKFPKARSEFPDLRDEAQLAKAEAILAEPASSAPRSPAPVVRPSRSEQSDQPREETSKDILARLKKLPYPTSETTF